MATMKELSVRCLRKYSKGCFVGMSQWLEAGLYMDQKDKRKRGRREKKKKSNQIALNTQALAARQAQCKWNGGLGVLTEWPSSVVVHMWQPSMPDGHATSCGGHGPVFNTP